MANKIMTVNSQSVSIEDVEIPNSAQPARRLRATAGQTIIESTHTFAATDGSRPMLIEADLQKNLDTARQRLAEEAAWREDLRLKVAALT